MVGAARLILGKREVQCREQGVLEGQVALVKLEGGARQIMESFVGQVKNFGLYSNSKWEANRVLIQGGNEDGHRQSDVRLWKIE